MDSSTFTSENESLSEVETLKQQLNTYKMINADLSKKIQQLKVELNAFKQENSVIKREVLEERAKTVEYKQLFTTMNTHCIQFINTYVNAMQQINDNDASLIEAIPGLQTTPKSDDDHDSPQNMTVVPQTERLQRPAQHTVRSQLRTALNEDENTGNNVLNTILEESIPIFTSTPIVPNRPGTSTLTSPVPFITPSPATPMIPQNLFKSPNSRKSDPVPDITTHDSSSMNISETVLETPKLQTLPPQRRISIVPDDEIEEYPDKENENDGEDTTEHTNQHDTVKEKLSLRVALSPLKSAYLQNNNNKTNTESPEYESYDEESTVDQTESMSNSSRALKRKSSESGRPRRKARPDPKSLKEPSLRTKLRRSKRKT